jgi:hypothetical protein
MERTGGGPPPLFDCGPGFQSGAGFQPKNHRDGPDGGIRHPFYQQKRIICICHLARIRRPAP